MGNDQKEIHELLFRLGVTANYRGFYHTAAAVELCREDPEGLLLVTKWVYPVVAKQCHTNWKAVERNIRTVNCIIWRENRPLLEALAHRPLAERPSNARFLAILVSSLRGGSLAEHGLGQAVALPGKDHDVGVVDEPVDERGGKPVVPKYGVPLAELQVGGDDEAPALIAV